MQGTNAAPVDATGLSNSYKVSSGTGFYVTKTHIITNEHVVQNCRELYIRGDKKLSHTVPEAPAKILKVDKKLDLALLLTAEKPKRIAVLRANSGIKQGDEVMVIGYPKEHGMIGEYHIEKGNITKVKGEYQKEERLEFTDSVRQGNSGGPLFDANGNVIGVIKGILTYYDTLDDYATDKFSERTGVAVPLAKLKDFLKENHVFYRLNNTYGKIPDDRVENSVQHTIVNVHCIQDDTATP